MKKYVFAGASQRALNMFCKPMLADCQGVVQICGVYDINFGRAKTFVAESGATFPAYDDFDVMQNTEKPDFVIVTTVDVFHAEYIIRSLEAGCDVITEKPMTTSDELCRNILAAEKRTGHKVIVTFNYRYAPFMTKVKELIASGTIGDVYSVHFEWLLTRNMALEGHGASYFRRWNARMAKSGGLLVHKSTHHFDLVNWWLGQRPEKVSAFAQLRLYGAKNSPYADVPAAGLRCANCPHAKECEFFYKPTEFEERFYVANESYDGYMKDNCVYAGDIDIYDTMAVTVQYDKGAAFTVEQQCGGWVRASANGGLGIPASCKATDLVIELAKEHGVGIVNLKESHHNGAEGVYANKIAQAGMVGMVMSTGNPIMAITGSREATIGNNPFAYAVPAGKYGTL